MRGLLKIFTNKSHISTGVFTAGRLITTALHMIGGLLTVRLVEPSALGYFNRVSIVQGYLIWLGLGVFSGLSRELPFFYGKGNTERAHVLAATAYFWALFLSVSSFMVFFVAGLYCILVQNYWLAAALMANAVLAFHAHYYAYLAVTFRTKHDFVKLAVIDVSVAVISVLSLVFVWCWKYYGICLRGATGAMVALVLMYVYRPVRVKPRWSTTDFKYLLKSGIPIYVTGYLAVWWQNTVSPTWIAWRFDVTTMGLFAFTGFVNTALSLFSGSVAQVYYPRLVEDYAKQNSIRHLFRLLLKPISVLIPLNVCLFVAGWFLLPHIVPLLAPKYADAIPAARCTLLNAFLCVFSPMLPIFYVLKQPLIYLTCILAGIAGHVGTLFLLGKCSESLVYVIVASLVGQATYIGASVAALVWLGRKTVPRPLVAD
jgi:hypothetical protein